MRASTVLLLLSAVARSAGYNCLFIGHSFFVPIANKLIPLAASAGVTHTHNEVFSGGASGVPSALWQSDEKRNAAQKILDGGDIELFGMTIDVGTGTDGQGEITTASYELWIDYALSKNPSTIIMIGTPWADYPSDYDTPTYTAAWRGGYPALQAGVFAALRAKYPSTTIIENPYGQGVVEARLLFEAGGLPDVTSLFGGCANDETGRSNCGAKLFSDNKGHGGDFLKALAGLIWLNRLYGVDLATYESPEITPFATNITAVAKAVLDAFDAGDLCGVATCSTCDVTTPCGVPPKVTAPGGGGGGGARVGIIVGAVVGGLALLALLGLGIYCHRRRSGAGASCSCCGRGAQAKGGGDAATASAVSAVPVVAQNVV